MKIKNAKYKDERTRPVVVVILDEMQIQDVKTLGKELCLKYEEIGTLITSDSASFKTLSE